LLFTNDKEGRATERQGENSASDQSYMFHRETFWEVAILRRWIIAVRAGDRVLKSASKALALQQVLC
jgi:hypothetical protein